MTNSVRDTAITVAACVTASRLAGLTPSGALTMFRPPEKQHRALLDLAREAKCCVSTVEDGRGLIGYAAFHPPSDIESWGDDRTGRLIELGAVEVDPAYRGGRLAQRVLTASFAGGRFNNTVVFATMYAWHYDLQRTGLSDFAYRRMLERLYRSVGMKPYRTSDPEIRSDAANGLMARVGPDCPADVLEEFERLRTRRPSYGGF